MRRGAASPRSRRCSAGSCRSRRLYRIIPVKFVGGVLAIGAGLALGREGPSVHMGATMAHLIGKLFGRNWPDCRVLLAAGAGAGLVTAFNAPIAGAISVLEELVRRFEPRIAIAALGASATAIAVSRVLLGNAPDFHVEALNYGVAETRPLYFVLGAIAGLHGDRLQSHAARNNGRGGAAGPVARRAARGTDRRRPSERWLGSGRIWWVAAIRSRSALWPELRRLAILPTCLLAEARARRRVLRCGDAGRAVRFPCWCWGRNFGLFFGLLSRLAFPDLDIQPEGFAVVGMAAFFTGVVRAPLTGMVLVTEMTSNVTMLLPMLRDLFLRPC